MNTQLVARPAEVWLVPASLPLSALRDAIYCVTDINVANVKPEAATRNALFYLEGGFYIDTRHEEFQDYSEPLRDFCKMHRIAAPLGGADALPAHVDVDTMGFGKASMHDVCFGDLALQVNSQRYKYYYCHQGLCEHALVVANIRQRHMGDPPTLDAYPLRMTPVLKKMRVCPVCTSRAVAWCACYVDCLDSCCSYVFIRGMQNVHTCCLCAG